MADAQQWLEQNGVPELLSAIVENLCHKRPTQIVPHIQRFLSTYNHNVDTGSQSFQTSTGGEASDSGESDTEGHPVEEVTIDDLKSEQIRRRYSTTTRRSAVSSEVMDATQHLHNDAEWKVKEAEKISHTPEQHQRIERCLQHNILFRNLEKDALAVVINHLFERSVSPGEVIIRQFDQADNFYIIEAGLCNVLVRPTPDGEDTQVATLGPESCFGELALMYGTPRAATVTASTDMKLWCLDRDTYRHILFKHMLEKRRKYEEFLKKVPILETLTDYERLTVADALQNAHFKAGSVIVREGDPGNSFYMIVKGEVQVTQKKDGAVIPLSRLKQGDFFGEVALMLNQPRVATVTAVDDVICVKLDRKSFKRLLGPIQDLLKRNMTSYSLYIKERM